MIETVIRCDNCGGHLSRPDANTTSPVPDPRVIMVPQITWLDIDRRMYHWDRSSFCGPVCLTAWIGKTWDVEKNTLINDKPEAVL